MADKGLPKWQERQKLLYSYDKKGTSEQLSTLGERALKEGHLQDALEYFRIAKNKPGLEKLAAIALEEGDAFLLTSVERCSQALNDDLWNKLGYRAFELGKHRFAKIAFERTKNELMLAKIAQTTGGSDDPQPLRPPGAHTV